MNRIVLRLVGLLSVLCFFTVSGQNMSLDTMKIEEVSIVKSRKKYLSEGHSEVKVSQQQIEQFSFRSLSELLQYSSNVNVRSYGSPGATSSVSFRGLGSSQTQVNWNGFPINSVTLGSANVANIPVVQGQSIVLSAGASGVNYGSGTFGGAVNIDYNPNFNISENQISSTLTYGSMNSLTGAAAYHVTSNKLKLSGSIIGGISDGDFKYYDEIKNKELRRTNGDYNQLGIQQYFTFKNSAYSELKGGVWASSKDLNLPAIEGASLDNYENQKDSTLRLFLQWKKLFRTSSLSVKGAWFYSDQHYIKKESVDSDAILINSRINSKTWFGDLNYRLFIDQYFSTDVALTYSYALADVDAYEGQKLDRFLGFVYALKYKRSGHHINFGVRKEFGNNVDSKLLFNVGGRLKVLEDKWYLRAAFSQKFRRPTFNDLFWVPGGNTELTPEKGYSFEFGSQYVFHSNGIGKFDIDGSLYYSEVKDMISWKPNGGIWDVQQYDNVITKGFDALLNHQITLQKILLEHQVSFAFNKAKNIGSNKALVYAPKYTSSIRSNTSYKGYKFSLNWRFVSERVYNDYGKTLDPYWLMNSGVSKDLKVDKHAFTFALNIDNLFDKHYQMIRSYPMPGRLWQLKIKYSVNLNNK